MLTPEDREWIRATVATWKPLNSETLAYLRLVFNGPTFVEELREAAPLPEPLPAHDRGAAGSTAGRKAA